MLHSTQLHACQQHVVCVSTPDAQTTSRVSNSSGPLQAGHVSKVPTCMCTCCYSIAEWTLSSNSAQNHSYVRCQLKQPLRVRHCTLRHKLHAFNSTSTLPSTSRTVKLLHNLYNHTEYGQLLTGTKQQRGNKIHTTAKMTAAHTLLQVKCTDRAAWCTPASNVLQQSTLHAIVHILAYCSPMRSPQHAHNANTCNSQPQAFTQPWQHMQLVVCCSQYNQ